MSSIDQRINKFTVLRMQINNASNENYQRNREIFNELKNLLIETGFDREVITIDHNDKFFTPPKDYEKLYDHPEEKFKDHQGRLASLCTKAIRDLKQHQVDQNQPIEKPTIKTKIEKEFVYPSTSWRFLRNGLFWTIFLGILSLSSLAFFYLGQNSKEKENAELVNENSDKKSEIRDLKRELLESTQNLEECNKKLEEATNQLLENKTK